MSQATICVIYNPMAGRGRASRRLEALQQELGEQAVFQPTQGPGHGDELARKAVLDGFSVVAAAGGDGTVHEVANGILQAGWPDVALAVFPLGSANDYAFSLGLDAAGRLRPDAPTLADEAVDVGRATSRDGRQRYFINGLGLGFNGAVTLESRRIRWLRGLPLYSLALFRAMVRHFVHPRMQVTMDGQTRDTPTLALTINLGHREGGFKMTPTAVLDDSWFDYVHAGPLKRWQLLRYFPAIVSGSLPADHPTIWLGRCRQIRVESEAPLTVHLDGEFFCTAADDVRQISVDLLPRKLRVQRRLQR
jgi:diacylglycerol kinase family enzyme